MTWISEFAGEKEVLFTPLTGLEVAGYRVDRQQSEADDNQKDGAVLVVELQPTVNPKAVTIDALVGKRKAFIAE